MQRSRKEWLKEQLDKLDVNEHLQIFEIVKKHTDQYTSTPTGVFISTANLSEECLLEIEKYILFCIDQRKRMEEDLKTRKNYERLV